MRLTRRGRLTITLSVLTVILLVAAYALTQTRAGTALGIRVAPPCTVTVDGDTEPWSFETARTATTLAALGQRRNAPLNQIAAALARTGKPDIPMTPAAARATYAALPVRATPTTESVALARALLGYDGAALTCTVPSTGLGERTGDVSPREEPGALGLTPRADKVRAAMREAFGKQTLGGFSPEGVRTGHIEGSAHYDGRAIDVFFRPITPENTRIGWLLAHWLTARADKLALATVIFDERIWIARQSVRGWRIYEHPQGFTTNPILLHKDHVHVDVQEGG